MTAASILGGSGLLIAAYAFHVRARLLGDTAHGWPGAPRFVRYAIDAALLPMVPAGLWWIVAGSVPQWLMAAVSLGWAAYGSALAFNMVKQRGEP